MTELLFLRELLLQSQVLGEWIKVSVKWLLTITVSLTDGYSRHMEILHCLDGRENDSGSMKRVKGERIWGL